VEALRAELGDVPVLFISGYADSVLQGELGPRIELLEKPFGVSELLAKIAGLLAAPR
jgi:DNA-binding response OmpR family regulator